MTTQDLRFWLKEWRHSHSPYGEKCDRNGYAPSIMSNEQICYYDGCTKMGDDVTRHEVYYGSANRKTSKACGFWVYVCPEHHEMYHSCRALRKKLAKDCQFRFEISHSREEFRELIGKSYL